MNAAILMLSLGAPADELELAKAAAAAELAKLALRETPKDASPVLPTVDTYAAVYARVLAGERVTWTGTPDGLPHGTYQLWLSRGVVWMSREEVKPAGVSFFRPGVSTVGTSAQSADGLSSSSPAPVRSPAVIRTLAPTAGFSGGIWTSSGCPPSG